MDLVQNANLETYKSVMAQDFWGHEYVWLVPYMTLPHLQVLAVFCEAVIFSPSSWLHLCIEVHVTAEDDRGTSYFHVYKW